MKTQLHRMQLQASLTIPASTTEDPNKPFTMVAYAGSPMAGVLHGPGANYKHPIVIDSAGVSAAASIPILMNHDEHKIVGQGQFRSQPDGSIVGEGHVMTDLEHGNLVAKASRSGFSWQASVGGIPSKIEFVRDGRSANVNSKTVRGPVYIVRAFGLREVSFVSVGADANTSASVAASFSNGESNMNKELKDWLLASGWSSELIEAVTEEQAKLLTAAYEKSKATEPAEEKEEQNTSSKLTAGYEKIERDFLQRAANAAKKHAAFQLLTAKYSTAEGADKLLASAIEGDWSEERLELSLLRASRPKAPAAHINSVDITDAVIEASLCRAARMSTDALEESFDEKTLEASEKRFRSFGLSHLLAHCAREQGYLSSSGFVDVKSDLRNVLRAAFSYSALPGILSNTANKFLLQSFNAVENTWRQIAAVRSVNDFKASTSYRLTGDMQYEQVPASGVIPHGTLGELSYTNKAETYAKMLSITRQDIINDDLGAMTTAPARLGRGAALKLNDVFWKAFMDNSTFFTSGRGNYIDGSTTNLSIDSLTTLEALFYSQTDSDGKPLAVSPAILLVPNALFALANQIMKSTLLNEVTALTSAATAKPSGNPHEGKFRVARSAYLSNASYTGYSSTAWYLLADPMDLATIEVAFLFGQEAPTIESADADFNTLGIQLRGYHDFGVAKQEYRAGAKSLGVAS